ncbi:MAG: diguanylate cyclase [Clostridia bacterium]|nr:diguanylate cyclase [Clostridia bacterium]
MDGTVKNRRIVIIMIAAALVSALAFILCAFVLGIGEYNAVKLDDPTKSETLDDGSVIYFVPIPAEARRTGMAFCFSCYNSAIRVVSGENTIYTAGEYNKNGLPIGHLLLTVSVPDEAWGGEIKVVVTPQNGGSAEKITSLVLLPETESRLYPLIDNIFDFLVFLPVTLIALAAVPVFAMLWICRFNFGKSGFCLAAFLFLTGCWYLGFQGIMWVFSDNRLICSNLEYYALYLLPLPFLGYLRQEHLPDVSKKILLGFEIAFAAFAVFSLAATLIPGGIDYLTLVSYLRILILVALAAAMVIIFLAKNQNRRLAERVLRGGLIATMAIAALETGRIALDIQLPRSFNFSRIMIMVFLSSLLISFILREYRSLRTRLEREQLRRLAYVDILTGIPNRQDIEKHAEEMSEQDRKRCAVLFFDANGLKKANDEFGHAAGDSLLREVGNALSNAMEGQGGFFGRYGGDEFAACVHADKAEKVRKMFYEELEKKNGEEVLPFKISVACGIAKYADYPDTQDMNLQMLIRFADKQMYINKQEMKACR